MVLPLELGPAIAMSLIFAISSSISVSYTHLDVYKRQALDNTKRIVLRINRHYDYLEIKPNEDKKIEIDELF